jgi:serine/threonine protein kinase
MALTSVCDSDSADVYVVKVLADDSRALAKEIKLVLDWRKEPLMNEILLMRELTHPNIVRIVDTFLIDVSTLWLVMECVHGTTLAQVIEQNSLEEKPIARITHEVSSSVPRSVPSHLSHYGRYARVSRICTPGASSIATSNRTTSSSVGMVK